MNRRPRDPFDFDSFNNDSNGSPFGGFNDPFFKQFEEMHSRIFRDFFGEDDTHDRPFLIIEPPNSSNPHSKTHNRNHNNGPDLSEINPNAPQSNNANENDSYPHRNDYNQPSFFSMLQNFKHFFEPEYDDHKLSDINPNISDNGPIMNNESDNKGLIHPNTPPGFRSPYLPNSTGAEKDMQFDNGGKSYFRSQSVVISTDSEGRTIKTTTVRDQNGERVTTEELNGNGTGNGFGNNSDIRDFFGNFGVGNGHRNDRNDRNGNGFDKRIEWFGNNNGNGNENGFKLFERTHDPFEKFRAKWQNWRWNPYNWGKDQGGIDGSERGYYDRNENRNEGIKWKSYKDYKHGNKGPSLLDDIVVKDNKK